MASISKPAVPAVDTAPPTQAQIYNFFVNHLDKKSLAAYTGNNEGYTPGLTPLPCESIGELLAALKAKIHITKPVEQTFVLMMATAISLEVDGPFIWMHIAGPSSSLKTTLLDLLGTAHDKVFSTTEFTSFYSGSTFGGKDNSLLPQLQGKVFIIKDLTPLLQSKLDTQNTVFGQMRSIYDGTGERWFNNGVQLNFTGVRFVCLTGVTEVIYTLMRSDMGERFVITDINSEWTADGRLRRMEAELNAEGNAFDSIFDTIATGLSANDGPKLDSLGDVRRMCWGFYNHLLEYMQDEAHGLRALALVFKADRTIKAEIDALAVWMEHARLRMPNKNEDAVRISPAEPHRTIKILSKIAMCCAIVLKATSVTDEVRDLLRKVTFDSGRSYNLEVMNYIASYPETDLALLASKMKLSKTKVAQHCDHLISIGVLEQKFKKMTSGAGQPSSCYCLTLRFRLLADIIGLREQSLIVPKGQPEPATGEQYLKDLLASISRPKPKPFGRQPVVQEGHDDSSE